MKRRIAILCLVLGVVTIGDALARPGGGGSFSGGGGHGGSGGGGDGGGILQLLYYLIRLCFEAPHIGVPILLCVIGYFAYSAWKQRQNKDWDSGPPIELHPAIDVDPITHFDPDFSRVLFEDFAFRLFSTAHRARHADSAIATIAPYLDPSARVALRTRVPENMPVESVVVGAMRITEIDMQGERAKITVEFEANVSTKEHTYYSVETWRFSRDAWLKSKPPAASRSFPCPNCGAPWQGTNTGTQTCASCGEVVDNGRFDWIVDLIGLRSNDERAPTLLDDVPERGTNLETYSQPEVNQKFRELEGADPATSYDAVCARLELIYAELNRAWMTNDLRPARGFVSDGLYDYLTYWTDAYKRQGLRNVLEDMKVTGTVLAKVTRDRSYDALTIRVRANGLDYTIREATGEVLKGNKRKKRAYSEYWTLIRSATRKGAPTTAATCPNCGAPLAITQAGECEHCSAHVTAGEFDWVLSKIEQDDSYRG